MRHGSLFSGQGGFDLAADWLGWTNIFQVEKDKKCQKILKYRFPQAKLYGDIKEFSATGYTNIIDVLSGGFPCQSFSLAGKGALDLSLWKEMFRVICECSPNWVVAENVYGLLARKKGLALEVVCADLESKGYTVLPPLIIPAFKSRT